MKAILLIGILFVIILYIYVAIIWFVWNIVVPTLGGPEITFFQAFGIFVLVQLLTYSNSATKSK